jgi:hypothetical protein
MAPPGSTEFSYQDSPQGGGVSEFQFTAVAVCRADCKDKVLSTYYFEFDNDKRNITTRDPNNIDHQKHLHKGNDDWDKRVKKQKDKDKRKVPLVPSTN